MQKQINSLIRFKNNQGAEARGTLLKLSRASIVFEVYNPYSIIQLSEVLQGLTIFRGETPIYQGKAVVSSLVNTGLMLVVSAALVENWSGLTDNLNSSSQLHAEVEQFIHDWGSAHQLAPRYQIAVGELRSFLSELNRWVEQVDAGALPTTGNSEKKKLHNDYFRALSLPVVSRLDTLFKNFENEAKKIDDDSLAIHKIFAQTDLHPLMMRSPFFYRSYTKPLGYAGDYEMVNMMTRDEGQEGPTTYTQIVNSYYYNIGPTRAHRNRIDILVDHLTRLECTAEREGEKKFILNIGCGPALEIQQFIKICTHTELCDFTLMDFNKETIEYARNRVSVAAKEENKLVNINFIEKSVHALLQQSRKNIDSSSNNRYDFVYCAGLFDYLSDRVCARLLELFYQWVKPGGIVLSTNVHPNNPSRWTMEHIVEWYLIHRDDEEMLRIASSEGEHSIYMDLTGFNVFLETYKPISNG